MPSVKVDLADRGYAIHIDPDLLTRVGPIMRDLSLGGKVAVVTHPELPASYAAQVHASLEDAGFAPEMAFVPQGEASKSLDGLESLYTRFAGMRLDRQCAVVALGGGVIGDLAGFAAATYLRGLPLVQVPTTLLSQVDASIGGKTAIDLPAGKNLVGAFHQPRAVVADVNTLTTLPAAELHSGLAEVVKYGVIADAEFFASLERHAARLIAGDRDRLANVVKRSCEIKAAVVRQDPEDRGLRAILNYGHTFGHALETAWGYGTVTHGAAVAIGMSLAARLSVRLGSFDAASAARQDALLRRLGLPALQSIELPATPSLLAAMVMDKKAAGGRLRFVLPRAIGVVDVREVDEQDVVAVLEMERRAE